MPKLLDKLVRRSGKQPYSGSFLRNIIGGSLYRISDIRSHNTAFANISTQINTMRALAVDSQIATALSYYATDATTPNTTGDIIWATSDTNNEVADIVNELFKKWRVKEYARDHILELATVGNLYLPTTFMYKTRSDSVYQRGVVLDNNTIPDSGYDIIPSTKIPPEKILHLYYQGDPSGYILEPQENTLESLILPEEACIHFSLGGLLGDYTIDAKNFDGDVITYDIKFAQPLLEQAVQPTQTLSLLEDALVLSSLSRVVKFVNVECGREEDEITSSLQMVKDAIEQQLSLNTATGDVQSFVNPQSPNNLIYLPKIDGQDAISITDLNMSEASDSDSKLLDYYQNKKLSVLGIPKEAMNFSSNEGLGGAGQVMSQRSALYSNALARIETAYMAGWTDAINKYFMSKNMSGLVNTFQLHMNPIITIQSTVQFDKRDSAINQANSLVDLLKSIGVQDRDAYRSALVEILSEVFPKMGSDASSWHIDVNAGGEG